LTFVQPNITETELQDTFKLLNKDGSGKVTMAQWKEFYLQARQRCTRARVELKAPLTRAAARARP